MQAPSLIAHIPPAQVWVYRPDDTNYEFLKIECIGSPEFKIQPSFRLYRVLSVTLAFVGGSFAGACIVAVSEVFFGKTRKIRAIYAVAATVFAFVASQMIRYGYALNEFLDLWPIFEQAYRAELNSAGRRGFLVTSPNGRETDWHQGEDKYIPIEDVLQIIRDIP